MSRFGWCLDGHHNLCRRKYVSQVGVTRRCDCDCHNDDDSPEGPNQ